MSKTDGIEYKKLERCMAFIEGALNVDISLAYNAGVPWVFFPAPPDERNDAGVYEDNIPFGNLEDATLFVERVEMMIRMGRFQRRGW